MSLSSLLLAHDAYVEKEIADWNKTRHLMYVMVKLWGDPKKSMSMEELMPLPGDKVIDEAAYEKEVLEALKQFNGGRS
jgi:hypothetical protein